MIAAKRLGWNVRAIIGNVQFAIETNDCTVVAERRDPRAWFEGHGRLTPWDPLQKAYFNVYALWTFLASPFLLSLPGVVPEEIKPCAGTETIFPNMPDRFNHACLTCEIMQPMSRMKPIKN